MILLVLKALLTISFYVILYTYAGYPLLLWLLVKIKRRVRGFAPPLPKLGFLPPVTLIVAAFNEGEILEEKIRNSLDLDYPADSLKLLFVTDGSTDNSTDVFERFPQVRHIHQPERNGKLHALNRAMNEVTTDYVIFSDANSLLNRDCVANLVRHYQDARVGGVAGEKKVVTYSSRDAVGTGEGLYWKYESWIKRMDADLNSVVGAAGELFSVRYSCYEPLSPDIILDDFVQSLKICLKGYIIKYDNTAFALETASLSLSEEIERKTRISAGGFQAIGILSSLLNPFRHPLLSFQYLSHRIFRWTLAPLALVILFISSAILWVEAAGILYDVTFYAQIAVYILALIGWWMATGGRKGGLAYVLFYFLMMNYCVFAGFGRFLNGRQDVAWQKARRG